MSKVPRGSSWEDQFQSQQPVDLPPEHVATDRTPALVISAVFGAIILAVIGYLLFDPSGDGGSAETQVAGVVEEVTTTDGVTTSAPTTTAPPTTTPATDAPTTSPPVTTAATTAPSSTTSVANSTTTTTVPSVAEETTDQTPSSQSLIDGISNPDTRTAVFSGGKVYLRGEVPSQEVADVISTRAAAVLGPENVVVEYEINPQAPVPDSAPLYVDDKVLFEVGSDVINPGFTPLLDLGTALMQQTDTVRIAVVAHTDSVGTAEFNQLLSERRAEAVKAYWINAGIAESRVDAIGLGESIPQADNLNSTGRAANRRAEFIVQGILG